MGGRLLTETSCTNQQASIQNEHAVERRDNRICVQQAQNCQGEADGEEEKDKENNPEDISIPPHLTLLEHFVIL
jgi:hypothetical protein